MKSNDFLKGSLNHDKIAADPEIELGIGKDATVVLVSEPHTHAEQEEEAASEKEA